MQSQVGQKVTLRLAARDYQFDKQSITVPVRAMVTMVFDNQDEGVPHNFALYENSEAKKSFFRGEIVEGPRTINYQFQAPAQQGDYFFRCDVHPRTMVGTFIVREMS